MRTSSARARMVLVAASALVAVVGAGAVLVLRLTNSGFEPEGRNWWIVAETLLALAYLPLGTALAVRGRSGLGIAFGVIGACALLSALAAEWHAFNVSASGSPVIEHGRLVQTVGLSVLVFVVPWLLPWPPGRGHDPMTRWLALGLIAAWTGSLATLVERTADVPGTHVAAPLLLVATVPLIAVGAFVADIRDDSSVLGTVSHRFLVWVILVSGVVLLYTALVAGFGLFLGADGPAWLLVGVTGGLAVAAEPVRSWLRHLVDDLVYGQRGDPLAVVRQLVNQQVATASDVNEALLASLAVIIADTLRLDHVAIDLMSVTNDWTRIAERGDPGEHDESFPLAMGDQLVGRLVVGCRSAVLGRRDRDVLADIVPHVTLAVGLVRLTGDLRRSRLSVVTAREEERRRLRRDLHDGVGPSLTGISMGLRTVVRRLRRTSSEVNDVSLLDRLADEVDASAGEVKRIVRDLRPTALDDQGLADALAEFARSLGGVLEVTLNLPSGDRTLPAAVETAIYRIAMEALNNVVRHAGATRCSLYLAVTDHVELDITDDGIGIPDRHPAGVGLTTMRERAAELGGATVIASIAPHGTRVHATLPLAVT
ncbi:MAG TPA: histidine kinase [Actinomycetes bacterium]|nr:histidine kinase [Actinomycetes bacterium]